MPSFSPLLAGLTLGGALLAGCPTDPGPDGGTPGTDGGDPTDGGGDPTDGGGDPTDGGGDNTGGESCADATAITPGTYQGTTADASDDFQGSCDTFSDEGSEGGDRVFSFTLEEESGVELSVSGYDAIVYLFEGSACTTEVTCADAIGNEENLSIPALPAGEYYVVVDTFIGVLDDQGNRQDEGGPFTLTFDVVDPSCVADEFDDNNTPETAINAYAGFQDIDTEEAGVPLSICEGDIDYFSVGHMGGALDVTVAGVGGDAAPGFELFSATPTIEDGDIVGYTQGEAVTNGEALDRGMYLLRVAADSVPPAGLDYKFVATHGCQGDDVDFPIVEFDDGAAPENAPAYFLAPEAPEARQLCAGDTDAFVLDNLGAGDVTVTLAGGSTLPVTVSSLTEEADGSLTPVALTEGTDYTTATSGSDLVVTLSDAAAGLYLVEVTSGAGATPVDYTFAVTFEALEGAPANDTCGTGVTLTPAEEPTAIFGRTYGATHTLAGPSVTVDGETVSCNGDGEVIPDTEVGPAPEVFYYLTLDAATNLDIHVDGSATNFDAALYMFSLTDFTCPADLSTLTPVEVDGAPLCEIGSRIRGRIPQAPAGDYLVVVDGIYSPPFVIEPFVFPEFNTQGAFEISATTYPGEFPPPAACGDATAIDVPTAGSPTTFDVAYSGAPIELEGGCGGGGAERAYVLTPTADVTLDIAAGGGANDVDTVVYVMEGECSEAAAALATEEAGTCNDDGENLSNFGSELTVSLTGGTTYYLVVDAYDETSGTAPVTISVAE